MDPIVKKCVYVLIMRASIYTVSKSSRKTGISASGSENSNVFEEFEKFRAYAEKKLRNFV